MVPDADVAVAAGDCRIVTEMMMTAVVSVGQ